MHRVRLLSFVICVVIAFVSLSWSFEKKAGLFEETLPVQAPDFIKSDAVMKVEDAYDEAIEAKTSEIAGAGSPAEAEIFQREIEELKEEKIIAVKETHLQTAIEEGKEEEVEALRNDLALFNKVGPSRSRVMGKQPLPGAGESVGSAGEKTPDDR